MVGTNRRGSILLEGLAGLALFCGGAGLSLEIVRRSQQEILLHHAAFWVARGAALAPQASPRSRVLPWWRAVYGDTSSARLKRLEIEVETFPGLFSARVHTRLPAWSGHAFFARAKSGFEVTRRCRFAFSP
jgi:hypothetical protein